MPTSKTDIHFQWFQNQSILIIIHEVFNVIRSVVFLQQRNWPYSGRAVHFWTKGAPIFFSEHFLVIRVCQKCQKCKISEKPGFWRNCGYISKMVRSIFMIFWLKTPLTINKRRAKKNFQNFLPFLRNNQLCKNWNFSKTRFFIFLKFKT